MIASREEVRLLQWEEVSEEQLKELKLSSRSNGRDSQYKDLLEAVKFGKKIKLTLEEGVTPKAMSQRLYTAAKAFGISVTARTTADRLALVISLNGDEKPAEPPPAAQAPEPPPEGEQQSKRK
jgi:hypothetical protein